MTEKKTWTAAPTKAPSAAGAPSNPTTALPTTTYPAVWGTDADGDEIPLTAELIGGGTIDELARAAKANNVMMTLSFYPAATDDDNKITQREALALGWLSAELARRSDAWSGNEPDWFPQPPEWAELWEQGLAATADERNKTEDEWAHSR